MSSVLETTSWRPVLRVWAGVATGTSVAAFATLACLAAVRRREKAALKESTDRAWQRVNHATLSTQVEARAAANWVLNAPPACATGKGRPAKDPAKEDYTYAKEDTCTSSIVESFTLTACSDTDTGGSGTDDEDSEYKTGQEDGGATNTNTNSRGINGRAESAERADTEWVITQYDNDDDGDVEKRGGGGHRTETAATAAVIHVLPAEEAKTILTVFPAADPLPYPETSIVNHGSHPHPYPKQPTAVKWRRLCTGGKGGTETATTAWGVLDEWRGVPVPLSETTRENPQHRQHQHERQLKHNHLPARDTAIKLTTAATVPITSTSISPLPRPGGANAPLHRPHLDSSSTSLSKLIFARHSHSTYRLLLLTFFFYGLVQVR